MAKAVKKNKKPATSFPVKTTFLFRGVNYKEGATIELSNEKTIAEFIKRKYI